MTLEDIFYKHATILTNKKIICMDKKHFLKAIEDLRVEIQKENERKTNKLYH